MEMKSSNSLYLLLTHLWFAHLFAGFTVITGSCDESWCTMSTQQGLSNLQFWHTETAQFFIKFEDW